MCPAVSRAAEDVSAADVTDINVIEPEPEYADAEFDIKSEDVTEPTVGENGEYLIGSAEELYWFAQNAALDADARLTGDIVINSDMTADESSLRIWNPIGESSSKKYSGSFDGGGYTVSGVYVNRAAAGAGFFGYTDINSEISNLTVDGIIIGTKNYTGGIVGDCYGTVMNCRNLAEIRGFAYVGGVVGDLENKTGSPSSMQRCANYGSVTAASHSAGGVVGRIDSLSGSAVSECYNTGSVSGTTKVGGIVGDQYAYGCGIKDVYNIGTVTASTGYAGGIIGNFRAGRLENAYMASEIIGADAASGGKIAGRLEAESQQRTFANVYYISEPEFDVIANLNGCTVQNGSAESKTEDELKQLAQALGDAFDSDTNNINSGFPVLKYQNGGDEEEGPESDPNGWDGKSVSEPAVEDGAYLISTAEELAWFAQELKTNTDINGTLTADIDLNNRKWTPMCQTSRDGAYKGSFDGGNYTVKNLYIKASKTGAALFAANDGSISGVNVSGMLEGSDVAAAVAAFNYGEISECGNAAAVTGGNYVGGICAYNYGTVSDCRNTGSVKADKYAGGVCAANFEGAEITRCRNIGTAVSGADFSGGICASNEGSVTDSSNGGIAVGHADSLRSYVGGVIGWNNGTAENLYNTGSVISAGSYTGGTVGISTSGTTAQNLYGTGTVMGMYYDDDENYRQYYVGAAVGRKTDDISNAYYLDTLAVKGGGISKTESEMKSADFAESLGGAFAEDTQGINGGYPVFSWQNDAGLIGTLPQLEGSVSISGNAEVGGTLTAVYDGTAENPIFVWYTADSEGEYVRAIGDTLTVPDDTVGQVVYVRVFAHGFGGYVGAQTSDKIEGMSGTVTLSGLPAVGRTLAASYSNEEDEPQFSWYRGSVRIPNANGNTYTVTAEDIGYIIKVRVTGNKAGSVEKAASAKADEAAAFGMWQTEECEEPSVDGGVYLITNEKELHWLASEINGGNVSAAARLVNDIELTEDKWYPIGSEELPFTGELDGNGKTVSDLIIDVENKNNVGFFGYVGGNGDVKNLTVTGMVNAVNASAVGGIAGYTEGRISRCVFDGGVSGDIQVGGIAGLIGFSGMVTECRNVADVIGSTQVGGIAGASSGGNTYYCVNTGNIGGENAERVGGIVGDGQSYAMIMCSRSTGTVTGRTYTGGIAGSVYAAPAPLGCYAAGEVNSGTYSGGVLGRLDGTDYIQTLHGSFYLDTMPADETAAAKTDDEMKEAAFVTELNNDAYADCYTSKSGGYPILKWESVNENTGGGGGGSAVERNISVSFTLVGDTVHGESAHSGGKVTWIGKTTVSVPEGTTAYDLFRKVLGENGYTYEGKGSGYVSYVTSPSGVRLGEFSNGAYSGWMYTINGKFADSMSVVTLKKGDNMVFFFADDYRTIDMGGSEENTGSTGGNGGYTSAGTDKTDTNTETPPVIEEKLPFKDTDGHWAAEGIRYVYKNGIMTGTEKDIFSPNALISRGMTAAVLYRIAGSPAVEGKDSFEDVAKGKYYYSAVEWAAANNIVNGCGDGVFAPDAPVTREQLAAMLYRLAELMGHDTGKKGSAEKFEDKSEISGWAMEALEWAIAEGLLNGTSETTLSPKSTATRAQTAVILMRFSDQ